MTHSSLAANTEIKVDVGTWKAVEGSHPIRVEADVEKKVDESEETNNDGEETIIVGPPPDLYIVGVEITQGIQNMEENGIDNSVPLIYGKPMVIRVFVESDSDVINGVTGKLRLIQYGKTKLELDENAKIDVGPSGSWRRENFDDSLNFIIYRGRLETANPNINYGDVTFEVEINPSHSITEKDYTNNKMEKTIYLHESPSLKLHIMLDHHLETGLEATDKDMERSLSYLKRVYPISESEVEYKSSRGISSWGLIDFLIPLDWWLIAKECAIYAKIEGEDRYRILLMNHDVPGSLGGIASGIPGRGAIVRAMEKDAYNLVGYNYATLTMAHELGHDLGLRHVVDPDNRCGGASDSKGGENYPYDHCNLSDDTSNWGYYGFDIQLKTPIEPWRAGDLMSYRKGYGTCEGRWISDYTYKKIFNTLSGMSTSQSISSTELSLMGYEKHLLVSGMINHTNNEVTFDPFYVITDFKGTYQPGEGNYSLELRDKQSNVLLTHSFELSYPVANLMFGDDEPEGEIGFFIEILPYPQETKTLVLKHNSIELASVTVSDHAPNVTVMSPNGGETLSGVVNVTWSTSDLDGDELHCIVEYSPDNGITWETLAINLNEARYPITTSYLPGSTEGLIRITASDGVNTGSDVSDAVFTVLEKAPEVTIVNPTNGTTITEGSHISLSGAGYDLEDGMLNDSALTWISDQNGVLGTGEDLWTRNLTRGVHTITLMGEDSDGNRGTDQIMISVIDSATIDTPKGTVRLSATDGVIIGACRVNESLLPALSGVEFPFGVFTFNISEIGNGQTVNVTIELPEDLPSEAKYWEYGRTIGDTTPHWYEMPVVVTARIIGLLLYNLRMVVWEMMIGWRMV